MTLRPILGGLARPLRFTPRRRAVLRRLTYGLLGSIVGFPALGDAATAGGRYSPRDELRAARALADAIVPRDDGPGALDAKVPERMMVLLRADPRRRKLYGRGFGLLDSAARAAGARSFARLDVHRRIHLIEALGKRGDARLFVERARADVFALFYCSEVGQRSVGYRPPNHGYPRSQS